MPYVEDRDGLLLPNPGSATDSRRRQPACTVANLTITDGQPSAQFVALP